jgi:hypothetical protein
MKGKMRVMNHSGDTATLWDTDPETREEGELSTEQVEKEFDRLVREGHLAFTVDEDFKTGDQIKAGEFDPEVHERVLVTPAFIGG